jgi:hypothetical protein
MTLTIFLVNFSFFGLHLWHVFLEHYTLKSSLEKRYVASQCGAYLFNFAPNWAAVFFIATET